MATENLGKCISLTAGADLSSSQYCFVEFNTSGQAVAAGDGEDAIGILQNDPTSGQAALVMVGPGISKLRAGAATAAGDYIGCDSTGRGVTAATADRRLGQFIEAAGAANDWVSVLFQKLGATA